MSDAIHSVRKFRDELKIGEAFWQITSLRGEPYAVEGPCEVLQMFWERNVLMVTYVRPWVEATGCIVTDTVSDLVNKHHGVFLNNADATAEFDRRRGASVEEQKLVFEFLEKAVSEGVDDDSFFKPRLPFDNLKRVRRVREEEQ